MSPSNTDARFAGSIPEAYERYLVPLIFEPYARNLAARASALAPLRVLEIAAGTGVLTRELAVRLAPNVSIVATDLSQPMLDRAIAQGSVRPIEWRQADALKLPFSDGAFDLVVCQFGVMFLPDKVRAFGEALRVLQPGGTFLFSVWDRIELNDMPYCVTQTLADLFPRDPPQFLARVPHAYYDPDVICRDLVGGEFSHPIVDTVSERSQGEAPGAVALAFCHGTPLRSEIEARVAPSLDDVTDHVTQALKDRFGAGPVEGRIQAHIISARR